MAKVTGPLFSTEARGRVGGLIYNTHRGMSTVKAQCAPAQPRSAKQLRIRAAGVTLARKWQGLLQTTRDAWNAYALLHQETDGMGIGKRLSGMNWYIRLNTRQMHAYNAILTNPPSAAAPDAPTSFLATGGNDEIVCTWASPENGTWNVTLYISGPHSAGAIAKLPRAKFQVNANANAATTTITGLQPGTYSVWARMFDTVNALVSAWQLSETIVT